ncbi:hypothetical protein DUI87_09645 [Hirundo rustica rustica]|uniref:Uncharacterized protein n=1 Tax=Hirundo rustica rustica TaxID=333673 RepID=A0A3M0KMR4_HIRRU|nr:hypothetical protein DUI87_09645 [Hirundo rustica rustica]
MSSTEILLSGLGTEITILVILEMLSCWLQMKASGFENGSWRLFPSSCLIYGVRREPQPLVGGGVHVEEQELRHLIEIQLEQRGHSAPNHDVKDNLMRSEKHLNFEMHPDPVGFLPANF